MIGPSLSIRYPTFYADLLAWFSLLELNPFQLLPLSCCFPVSFHTILFTKTLMPLLGIGTFFITSRALAARARMRGKESKLAQNFLDTGFIAIFLLYPSTANIILTTFLCDNFDDGSSHLKADLLIDCASAGHKAMEVYAGVMFVLIPLGVPAMCVRTHHHSPGCLSAPLCSSLH